MAQLWVKSSEHGEVQGPFTAIELRGLAAAGHIARNALISLDQVNWRVAEGVKGLFVAGAQHAGGDSGMPHAETGEQEVERSAGEAESTAGQAERGAAEAEIGAWEAESGAGDVEISAAEAESSAVAAVPPIEPMSAPLRAEAIGYAGVGTEGSLWDVRRRGTLGFTLVAFLMFISSGVVAYLAYFGEQQGEMSKELLIAIGAVVAFLALGAVALVLWLVWAYRINRDLRVVSGGRHSITPGQAVGFSLIPLFDAFWAVYMPARACGTLNEQLAARGLRKVSKGVVVTCQVGSVLCGVAMPGLMPMLYAVSMRTIQKGMNRLIEAG